LDAEEKRQNYVQVSIIYCRAFHVTEPSGNFVKSPNGGPTIIRFLLVQNYMQHASINTSMNRGGLYRAFERNRSTSAPVGPPVCYLETLPVAQRI
jgi:hypothetical protein